jgi:hypothetical protein
MLCLRADKLAPADLIGPGAATSARTDFQLSEVFATQRREIEDRA